MTDRRTQRFMTILNRRTRLMDRRQHTGPFRWCFIPVADFFRRIVFGSRA